MNSLAPADALRLAERCLEMTAADSAEVLVYSTCAALTRFAGNRIHQNVIEEDLQVSVRAVIGRRVGVAGTNRMDDEGLAECCATAAVAARNAPEDEGFPGLPTPSTARTPERASEGTLGFGPLERAHAAAEMIEPSRSGGLTAAGKVQNSASTIAVVNSAGVRAVMPVTEAHASVLSMGTRGGSGWADFSGRDAGELPAAALGREAASLAARSEDAAALDPGAYTVFLGPDAVGTFVDFLSYVGFSAKAVEEGSSWMTGHLGEQVLSDKVTIVDDACATDAIGLTFDFEGVPKKRLTLVDAGVPIAPVTDSYWAARTGTENTGHALPAPNSFGPIPLNLRLEAGDSAEEDMLASVRRGVYVTRFHYMNVEDPARAVFTGMTRDGTFLIEDGELTRPLKNLRFTQSGVAAFRDVVAVGGRRRYAGDDGSPSLVPAMLIDGFNFTGQTR